MPVIQISTELGYHKFCFIVFKSVSFCVLFCYYLEFLVVVLYSGFGVVFLFVCYLEAVSIAPV